ncbi:DUF2759 domain-containing protein [Priestia taiwanensis]|uniref:DUF2759 domain-containing protein n=1 Tax=Priestia taiwanensis TaxID=1347902 RepID=A0A917EQQ3_9BACI|nr:DUF2759 domain-containing protein [Priestia taiwanensis]GGE73976.1 hypothetical protein GCM10007140_24820 [Priestia taiwanensis]
MGLVIILALVTVLSLVGTLKTLKDKNFIGAGFGFASVVTFGWFVIMTVLNNGYPPTH